jgi:hypothetical protein
MGEAAVREHRELRVAHRVDRLLAARERSVA